jgi:hypothetical protein
MKTKNDAAEGIPTMTDEWQGRCYTCAHWQGDREEQQRQIELDIEAGVMYDHKPGVPGSRTLGVSGGTCEEPTLHGVDVAACETCRYCAELIFDADFGCVYWTKR